MADNEGTKSKRQRSPGYPSDGLEKCLNWARVIYDSDKKSTISVEIAAKHMGFNSVCGPVRTGISAMKKFGLLTEDGKDRVRITDDAIRVFLAPNEQHRLSLLRDLAQRPEIIREILSENPDGLPSDASLKFKLVTDRGFNESASAIFIKAIRETVEFARLTPGEYAPVAMNREQNEVTTENGQSDPGWLDRTSKAIGQAQFPLQPKNPTVQRQRPALHVELSDGTEVDIHATGQLTTETFEELMDYMNVFAKVLKKRGTLQVS